MIVGVISDVHTNCAAWKAVQRDLDGAVEEIWSLGDWLGYGNDPPLLLWDSIRHSPVLAVQQMAREAGRRCVVGNHDLAVLAQNDDELLSVQNLGNFTPEAWQIIQSQRQQLGNSIAWEQEYRPWLRAQSHLLSPVPGIYLTHGAYCLNWIEKMPFWYTTRDWDHEGGLEDLGHWLAEGRATDDQRMRCLRSPWAGPLLMITGHTHSQGLWQRDPRTREHIWPQVAGGSKIPSDFIQLCIQQQQSVRRRVPLKPTPDAPVWLNPGSVGQPRNDGGDEAWPGYAWAKYAILCWQEAHEGQSSVEFRWVAYEGQPAGKEQRR